MDIVALDVEMVVLKGRQGRDKNAAALVVVVGRYSKILYKKYIYYPETEIDFGALYYTSRFINGIKYDHLRRYGISISQVQKELGALLSNKRIIVCGGQNDFYSLGLSIEKFDVYDIHTHFWKYSKDKVAQPIGLKSLVWHYFGKKIRLIKHNPVIDARETLRLYTTIICFHKKNNINGPFNEIDTIK